MVRKKLRAYAVTRKGKTSYKYGKSARSVAKRNKISSNNVSWVGYKA